MSENHQVDELPTFSRLPVASTNHANITTCYRSLSPILNRSSKFLSRNISRKLFPNCININLNLSLADHFHIRDGRVLLALEDGINFFQGLAFGFDPVHGLLSSAYTIQSRSQNTYY